MIAFAAATMLMGIYNFIYALHSFRRKKTPAGAGALLLMLLCMGMAVLLFIW